MNIPVTKPYTDHRETEEIAKVVASGWFAQGPEVEKFEKAVAAHVGVSFAVATTSCTTALHLVLHAMGIGIGHDVLVPSFTFVASANCVAHTGAKPRFVDIRQDTFNIDILSAQKYIEENYDCSSGVAIHKSEKNVLKAIMVVHQFGLCADMSAFLSLADKYGLKIIEDSACALGAKIGSRHQGQFGNPACLSFHPRKSITTGEGGMILTDDEALAVSLQGLRSHGAAMSAHTRHQMSSFALPPFDRIGYNYRMTDLQAAMGLAQMEKVDFIFETRRKKAKRYNELLSGAKWLTIPVEPDNYTHTYQSYVCMLSFDGLSSYEAGIKRDRLLTLLSEKGIATRQGAHASHTLECYQKEYGLEFEALPVSYACDRRSLTLPLYVQMTDSEQDYVIEKLEEVYREVLS